MQPIHATCESTLELDSVREARIDKEARGVVPCRPCPPAARRHAASDVPCAAGAARRASCPVRRTRHTRHSLAPCWLFLYLLCSEDDPRWNSARSTSSSVNSYACMHRRESRKREMHTCMHTHTCVYLFLSYNYCTLSTSSFPALFLHTSFFSPKTLVYNCALLISASSPGSIDGVGVVFAM